jgi:hypothetical protein
MKTISLPLIAIMFYASSSHAFVRPGNPPKSAMNSAVTTVLLEAHQYIESQSDGLNGGHVNQPCLQKAANGLLVVKCSGSYRFLTTGGGESPVAQKFICQQTFDIGPSGFFSPRGQANCVDKRK